MVQHTGDSPLGLLVSYAINKRIDRPISLTHKQTVGDHLREHPDVLIQAAWNNDLPRIADCLDAGIDPAIADIVGRTALLLAADNPGIVRYLTRRYEEMVADLEHNKPCKLRLQLAHAHLLNDQFDKAQAIYKRYAGTTLDGGCDWNAHKQRFRTAKGDGLQHPGHAED